MSDQALTRAQCEEISAMLLRYAALVRTHRDRFEFWEPRSPFKGRTHEALTGESDQAEALSAKVFGLNRTMG